MNEHLPQLVLLGSISIDRIMNFTGRYEDKIQPDKLHVLSLSILIDNLEHTRGGVAANIAYSLALLGDHSSLLTSIGPDGTDYLDYLGSLDIDTTHVHKSQLPTSTFTVITDANDCQVGGFYPGAMADSDSLTLSPWHNTNSFIVVSPYDPTTMARVVQEAQVQHLPLIYDIGQQVSNVPVEDLLAGVKAAKVLILNDYELGVLATRTNQTEDSIKSQVPIVITTLGEQGSRIEWNSLKTPISIPAVTGLKVVDPTGAGDAYRAGFLYGYRRGWDLKLCGQLATVTASFALEHHGTQVHSYTKDQLAKRYQTTFNTPINL